MAENDMHSAGIESYCLPEAVLDDILLKRQDADEEVAKAVAFLRSEEAG